MENLDWLRIRAGLLVKEVAMLANISETTYRKMARSKPVRKVYVYRVLRVLSERYGYEIKVDDVSGLNIIDS